MKVEKTKQDLKSEGFIKGDLFNGYLCYKKGSQRWYRCKIHQTCQYLSKKKFNMERHIPTCRKKNLSASEIADVSIHSEKDKKGNDRLLGFEHLFFEHSFFEHSFFFSFSLQQG